MRSRQFKLGHVARYAFVFRNRTRFGAGFAARMTGETFAVEIHRLGLEVVMRIVAGQTTDACILRVVAFATRQPVGLKANVGNARVRLRGNLRPGAMTLATKL